MVKERKSKKKLWMGVIAGILVLIVVSAGFAIRKKQNQQKIAPERRTITEAIYALGKVKSDLKYEVKVGVVTTLKTLYVREGQLVKKGENLLQFEDSNIFKAPFDGIITKINSYPGEITVPQSTVLRLENVEKRYIEVALEQQGALRVKPGQKARVDFESVRSNQLEGKVATVFSREDEFIAHIDVENFPSPILPGMTADVVIDVGIKPNALVIPITSIHDGQVSVARDGKVLKLNLEIGAIDGEWAEVLSGDLKDSDMVMVRQKNPGAP